MWSVHVIPMTSMKATWKLMSLSFFLVETLHCRKTIHLFLYIFVNIFGKILLVFVVRKCRQFIVLFRRRGCKWFVLFIFLRITLKYCMFATHLVHSMIYLIQARSFFCIELFEYISKKVMIFFCFWRLIVRLFKKQCITETTRAVSKKTNW